MPGIRVGAGAPTQPALGSTRAIDVRYSFVNASAVLVGSGAPDYIKVKPVNDQANVLQQPWGDMSGVNKDTKGNIFEFLEATSFNFGIGCGKTIPIIGRSPFRSKAFVNPELQDYYGYSIEVLQGDGVAQGNARGMVPPYFPSVDVGIFFVASDASQSFSSIGSFTNLDLNSGAQGFGLFIGADGLWHYGIRFNQAFVATPLDVDVPLPYGGLWPETDPTQPVRTKWEWFASKNGQPAKFRLTLNNKVLVNTTLVDVGGTPVAAGLGSQLPDFVSRNINTYGVTGITRCGNGLNAGNASGTMTLNAQANPGDTTLSIAIAGPGGSFAVNDKLVIAGQTFFVTAPVVAAAVTTVAVKPAVAGVIAAGTSVAYTAGVGQIFPLGFPDIHFVAGPAVAGTFLE